jgi:hypothetical protein
MESEAETTQIDNANITSKIAKVHGVILTTTETKSSTNLANLDKFLEQEKITNSTEPWSKLDKTAKIRKLTSFADDYSATNNLKQEEKEKLMAFLKECLDRKKLQRVKDVVYDKVNGIVKDIPSLHHSKPTNHFTLKNVDKTRVSTLKSLPPKKGKMGTIKNTSNESDSEDDE